MIELDIREINYTQDCVKPTFKDGGFVLDTINKIKNNELNLNEISKINVIEIDGKFFSLDNRRLLVFKEALKYKRNQKILVNVLKPTDLVGDQVKYPGMTAFDDFHRKMNSKKPSQIKVKDGYPNWCVRIGEKGGAYVYDKHKRKVYLSQLSNKAIEEIGEKDPEMMKKIITLKLDKKNS